MYHIYIYIYTCAYICMYINKQGDIGDVFYLLEEGLVDVYVQKKGESSKQVNTYI
jgi:CRP-like cAMP-binding protein